MSRIRAAVITPFDAGAKRVLGTVTRTLQELGVDVFSFENIAPGASLANSIADSIRSSDFLVVDISRENPNVFYELGFAHALRKPTILIVSSESGATLPSALAGFQYIIYDPSNLRSLSDHLKSATKTWTSKAGGES